MQLNPVVAEGVRLVIFDLDGTLIDTLSGITNVFLDLCPQVRSALGIQDDRSSSRFEDQARSQVHSMIGESLETMLSRVFNLPVDQVKNLKLIEMYQAEFRKQISSQAPELLYAGVREGLQQLREMSIELAVATNKFQSSAEDLLTQAGIRSYFKKVIGADRVTRPKPDPEMGQKLLQEFQVSPENVLMVGDTQNDLLMAQSLGVASIAVTYGVQSKEQLSVFEPEFFANSFSDVVFRVQKQFNLSDLQVG